MCWGWVHSDEAEGQAAGECVYILDQGVMHYSAGASIVEGC